MFIDNQILNENKSCPLINLSPLNKPGNFGWTSPSPRAPASPPRALRSASAQRDTGASVARTALSGSTGITMTGVPGTWEPASGANVAGMSKVAGARMIFFFLFF